MPDLLLTHGYFLYEDEKERRDHEALPAAGAALSLGLPEAGGFDVEVFDTTFAAPRRRSPRASPPSPGGVVGDLHQSDDPPRRCSPSSRAAKAHGWTVVLGGPEAAELPGRVPGARRRRRGGGRGRGDAWPSCCRRSPPAARTVCTASPAPSFATRTGDGGRPTPSAAQIADLDSPPLARPRGDRHRALRRRLARAPRHGQRQPDHRARLPLPLPLVLARRLRLHPPPAQPRGLRRRAGAHRRGLPARSGLVRRRRLHHPPPLALRLRRRAQAPRPARALRDHLAAPTA